MQFDDINIDEDKIKLNREGSIHTLSKIQDAMEKMELEKEWHVDIELTWSDMQYIRRLLVADEISSQMSRFNIRETIKRRGNEKECME